jgi:hypothetical protein
MPCGSASTRLPTIRASTMGGCEHLGRSTNAPTAGTSGRSDSASNRCATPVVTDHTVPSLSGPPTSRPVQVAQRVTGVPVRAPRPRAASACSAGRTLAPSREGAQVPASERGVGAGRLARATGRLVRATTRRARAVLPPEPPYPDERRQPSLPPDANWKERYEAAIEAENRLPRARSGPAVAPVPRLVPSGRRRGGGSAPVPGGPAVRVHRQPTACWRVPTSHRFAREVGQ